MDATEREAEARLVVSAMFDGWRMATARFATDRETLISLIPLEQEAMNAYRDAIESRVRAELAATVRGVHSHVYTGAEMVSRDALLALLEAAP